MSKILLTGGYGFLGNYVHSQLKDCNVFRFRSNEFDLRDDKESNDLFLKVQPDFVIHMAARLGGIGDNRKYPAFYFEDNMRIGMNVLKLSAVHGIKRVINIGTVCSYPRDLQTPFNELDVWSGYPEATNAAYGVSKRALLAYSEALYKQYSLQTINLLMANLYGPHDDFHEHTSHVIPALIRKIYEAKKTNDSKIIVWGDGSPTRDFLFVEDAATGIRNALFKSDHNLGCSPINIATGEEVSIKQIVFQLCKIMKFDGEIIYDTSKPNGQPKRVLSIARAENEIGYKPLIKIDEGLKKTVDYFLSNSEEIMCKGEKYKQ